jgi:hypothetical protein
MSITAEPGLSLAELELLLRRVDPAAVLVRSRILRRVIKRHCRLGGLGLQVPHPNSYAIPRDKLLEIADADELGLSLDHRLPDTVLLLAAPDPVELTRQTRAETLTRYWRALFHARIHAVLDERCSSGRLTADVVQQRVQKIGLAEFEEIRGVLSQENLLLPPADDLTVYKEFVAVYLELQHFAPGLLARWFPTVAPFTGIDALVAEDLRPEVLFDQTYLPGASVPGTRGPTVSGNGQPGREEVEGGGWRVESEEQRRDRSSPSTLHSPPSTSAAGAERKLRWAAEARAKGNVARAAILSWQAAAVAGDRAEECKEAARADLAELARRLQRALELPAEDGRAWAEALPGILPAAARGRWTREERVLFDLQKVCIDRERTVYSVDLVEWAYRLFRQPLKRPLPDQGWVLAVKYLRLGLRRLLATGLPESTQGPLADLLRAALHHTEEHVRDLFRPRLHKVLEDVGLVPENHVEELARDRLVEELLDRVVERGYLNMGQVRDAIARNRLKLPDLTGPFEFVRGDPLIQANARLTIELDGVYRRGEIYLRLLQRFSSLFFGTLWGRLLVLYLVLPFGGAFMLLTFVEHLVGPLSRLIHPPVQTSQPVGVASVTGLLATPGPVGPLLAATAVRLASPHRIQLVHDWSVLVTGLFLLCMLHWTAFRHRVLDFLRLLGRGLYALFFHLPLWLMDLAVVRWLLQTRIYLFCYQYLLKPLIFGLTAGLLAMLFRASWEVAGLIAADVFVVVLATLTTRWGRRLEEAAADRIVRTWRLIHYDVVLGVIRFVMDVFRWLLDEVDRAIYTVDEWLRFYQGEGRVALVLKPILGLVWYVITYVVRFCVNLLIEPQINPIKHFPVVTVSHKLLLPLAYTTPHTFKTVPSPLAGILMQVAPVSIERANTIAASVVWGIPGIFGFLVWELKENWKLYRANQSPTLDPVIVSQHGETLPRLLRPGFHSGTVPKLFAKVRVLAGGEEAGKLRKQLNALDHVREELIRFVERDLLGLVAGSKAWGERPGVRVASVTLGTTRVRIELASRSLPGDSVLLDFEELAGWLVAGITRAGWLAHGRPYQLLVWHDALAGFYKLAGVDLVREQVRKCLPGLLSWTVTDQGLLVRPRRDCEELYDLTVGGEVTPYPRAGPPAAELPTLREEQILYRSVLITWEAWAETWKRDQKGQLHDPLLAREYQFLPPLPPPAPASEQKPAASRQEA